MPALIELLVEITSPVIVTVPCFSGVPWKLEQLKALAHRPLRTMRLPEGLDDVEGYADFVAERVSDLERYVLAGDSFGAVVALALAVRTPPRLKALVMSGGFAADPVTDRLLKLRIRAARLFPGPLYRAVTLRFHAASLASPHDLDGQVPWPPEATRKFFLENTPFRSYVARSRAAFSADYRDKLGWIRVPTLILTPSYDRLIGKDAARLLVEGIPGAQEVVLPNTGHMFRFSHPETYAAAIEAFLRERL